MLILRSTSVPSGMEALFPLVLEWGVVDDSNRSDKVANSSRGELESLVRGLDSVDQDVLFEWLEGPESYSEPFRATARGFA